MLPTTLWAQDKSEATEFCEKERKSRSGRNCEVVVHNYVGQLNNPAVIPVMQMKFIINVMAPC